MKRALPLGLLGLVIGASASGASEMHVTVYNNDLALVREVRQVEVPKGLSEYSFTGVPARIDATSVRLSGGKGLTVLEQNYRYDLVSRQKLLERYLDQTARIITKHDKVHEGILKTAAGSLVLETPDGVVLVNDDEIADITLPRIPDGLITRPTLVWAMDNSGATRRDLEVQYLTNGMAWHTEYVGAVDADDKRMRLSGWVSIENNSGATFENAHLKVVAGDVNRAPDPRPDMLFARTAEMSKSAGFQERTFFEYHLYDLERPTTIADREIKQIQLIEDREVPVEKIYVYEPTRGTQDVQVKLRFENTEEKGLGIPLPAGKLRVYREDKGGALEFAGEDRLDHTPRDEEVTVYLGNAFDLVGERQEMESRRVTDRVFERKVQIKLRNRKESGSVSIVVREHPGGNWTILESTHPGDRLNARDLEFTVPVKAGEEVVMTYRVREEH
ncbi:MAG: DUF4139 domain-containing protein [Gemmatimonadota bacterium]|nr:MAG: DUF4139 domain-containing protein [Gemmatimonadota bacterium]